MFMAWKGGRKEKKVLSGFIIHRQKEKEKKYSQLEGKYIMDCMYIAT